jgi:hypothetical protein
MSRPTRSEPIAVLGERRIPSPLQNVHHRLLDKAVQHGWDAKLSHPASGTSPGCRRSSENRAAGWMFVAGGVSGKQTERTLPQWAYRAPLGFDLKH